MKSKIKLVKKIVAAVVGVIVVLGVVFLIFGERVIKIGVEKAASSSLGVGVSIKDVDLALLRGRVGIDGICVENPPAYEEENLLELGKVRVKAKLGSMLSDTVVIREIKLDGINLSIEQKGLSNNLQDVIKLINAKTKEQKDEPAEEEEQANGEKAAKNLRIEELEITNVKVTVKLLPVGGKGGKVNLNLSPIRMTNLGSDDKLTAGKLAGKILIAIAQGVAKDGGDLLPEDMINTMQSTLDAAADLGKSAIIEGRKVIEGGKEVLEGLKGIFKSKSKDEE